MQSLPSIYTKKPQSRSLLRLVCLAILQSAYLSYHGCAQQSEIVDSVHEVRAFDGVEPASHCNLEVIAVM